MLRSCLGMGYHPCVVPGVIQRNVLENPAWYTAYTPYQAEIAQGRLEALINFQTMVTDLTGLPVANASLLDEGTAAAEAMAICLASARGARSRFFVDDGCHPQTLEVVETRAWALGVEVVTGDHRAFEPDGSVFGVLLQYPTTTGAIHDYQPLIERVHGAGALAVVAADPLALVLLRPPGEMGADIAVGSTQRFGVPMGFGGPHAAYIATRDELKRRLPGRVVGVSRDARGRIAYRLSLQTREQHIRREKATSNICTAQVLPAVLASMYAVYHGAEGLERIARTVHGHARRLAAGAVERGHRVQPEPFFDTVAIELEGIDAATALARARDLGFNLRALAPRTVAMALDETTRDGDVDALLRALDAGRGGVRGAAAVAAIGAPHLRTTAFLQHPVFRRHRSETAMLRYLHGLAAKDLTLANSMIPLGSCTMKLNATAEMTPVTWPEFGALHPFAPADQTRGYRRLVADLERMLGELTGFPAVSLQPNAGSQGELTGLLMIRRYLEAQGAPERRVCLIPESAHGTNPASAVMAGLEVVVVRLRRAGQHRSLRSRGQARAPRRSSGRADGHLPLDPRRVRGVDHPHLRAGARARRPGLHGRRQLQRDGRPGPARRLRRRRLPPQPAQDVLHPARRRRSRAWGRWRRPRISGRTCRVIAWSAWADRRAWARSPRRPGAARASSRSRGCTSR